MIQVAINGATGRMGRRLVALAMQDPELEVVAALDHESCGLLGQDVGRVAGEEEAGVPLTTSLNPAVTPDVVIDFSVQPAVAPVVKLCVERDLPLVTGTTGLTDADHEAINSAADSIAVLQAPNTSLGVNLLFALVGQVARQLGDDYDIEVVEAHHRFKQDAPSGTAMGLIESICAATGKDINNDVKHGRSGMDPRKPGEIGSHALRLGDEVGRHTVSFATLGEEVLLSHRASTRDTFVNGALRAAKWLHGKPAGRYGMKDVLGL